MENKKESKKTFTMIPINNNGFYNKSEKLNILHLYIVERVRAFESNDVTCYISNERFAQETNCSISTIKRAIKLLIDLKILWAGYHYEGEKNKQRILRIYNEKAAQNEPHKEKEEVQNEPQRGSNCTEERFKMNPSEVQNEPLINNKYTNNKLSNKEEDRIEESKEELRSIGDLTEEEEKEISSMLREGVPYNKIKKIYHLKPNSITKDFKEQWEVEHAKKIDAELKQRFKNVYQELSGYWKCSVEELRERVRNSCLKYTSPQDVITFLKKHPEYQRDAWEQEYGNDYTYDDYGDKKPICSYESFVYDGMCCQDII